MPSNWQSLSERDQCEQVVNRLRKTIRGLRRAKRQPDPWEATYLVEAIGAVRLCDYEGGLKAADLADLRGRHRSIASPIVTLLSPEELEESNLDRLSQLITRLQCPGAANEAPMTLQSTGNIEFGPEGFCLQATDGQRKITFVLSEDVAVTAFNFDIHSAELLEQTVRDQLPALWNASRHAYDLVRKGEAGKNMKIYLSEDDFLSD